MHEEHTEYGGLQGGLSQRTAPIIGHLMCQITCTLWQWRRKHETSGGADRVWLRSSPARAARPPRVARNFFSLGALKWSRIALMGSLQISTGSALGKSSMQE